MTTIPQITDERVDDIPVLLHTMTHQLNLVTLLDDIRPRHGNWLGLSLGQVMVTWLTHILSEYLFTASSPNFELMPDGLSIANKCY